MAEDQKPETHIEEKEALQLAKKDGIEFIDYWTVEGEVDEAGALIEFSTEEEAKEVAEAKDKPYQQNRIQKPQEVSNE